MPGDSNPPKAPHSSFSTHSHHGKYRWEASSSSHAATATAVDHKSSAGTKSKPSPNSIATPSSNRDPSNKHAATRPNSVPDNPSSSRPQGSNSIQETRPVFPFAEPPPPPSYGFHMLDHRSIALVDGSVRSYFALPPDYENITRLPRLGFRPEFHGFGLDRPPFPVSPEFFGPQARARISEHWHFGPENPMKRKFGEEERGGRDDGFERQRQQLLQYGNANAPGQSWAHSLARGEETRAAKQMRGVQGSVGKLKHTEVDQNALKKAFFNFAKLVYETTNQRKKYLAEGKQGAVSCLPCGRSTKDFPDTHSLIMHAYNSDNADSVIDHLAFHKAVCILLGWNYSMPPDNSKVYQNVSADDAEANRYDLIMWPPTVLIHNTIKGKGKDGRVEGIGNRAMDGTLRDLGFTSGKSMSLHSHEGFLGMHAIKYSGDESGLKNALKLADYFEREKRGRKDWAQVQHGMHGKDEENNPNLMKTDSKTGEKKRVLYGHLATVTDLDKVNYDIRKRVSIVSMRELRESYK